MKTKKLLLSIFMLAAIALQAQLKVASILGNNMVLQQNTEVKIWGTATPNQKLTVTANWNNSKVTLTSNEDGKWLAKIKTTKAGGPYTITIAAKKEKIELTNILLGEVWLCSGQSNMEMPIMGFTDQPILGSNDALLEADNDNIRLFTVKRASLPTTADTCSGSWSVASAESVAKFSAVGYLYAKLLQKKLNVPVGIVSSNWGGSRIEAWINKENMTAFPEALAQTTKENTAPNHKASHLYNGMIYPILNYVIKGALWYQGESNIKNYKDYSAEMQVMLRNWRKDFGVGNFPFYFVQIAPFAYKNSQEIGSVLLRDEQLKASLAIPNAGMVVTVDIGDENTIHPADKYTVAKRLVYRTLSETYGMKGISYESPTYKNMVVKDSIAFVSFDNNALGFSSFGKRVDCFEIAGDDKVFYPASIKILQKQIQVWASEVKTPVAVRYAYRNFPKTEGFIYNSAGLPLCPFRTDNWEK
jgi:sialate O-acetylesterase